LLYKATLNRHTIQSGKTGILKNTGKLVFFKSVNLYLLLCIPLNASFVNNTIVVASFDKL
jgi:hypothetical protein